MCMYRFTPQKTERLGQFPAELGNLDATHSWTNINSRGCGLSYLQPIIIPFSTSQKTCSTAAIGGPLLVRQIICTVSDVLERAPRYAKAVAFCLRSAKERMT